LTLRVRTIFHRIEELEDELDRISARVAALEKKAAPKPSPKRTK
jgi:ubiquinone biosynthesis protein UbiJ